MEQCTCSVGEKQEKFPDVLKTFTRKNESGIQTLFRDTITPAEHFCMKKSLGNHIE